MAAQPSTFNSQLLQQHFDTLAETPGAPAKLGEFVLELAERGTFGGTDAKKVPLHSVAEFVMGQAPAGTECNETGEGTIFVKAGEFGPLYAEVRCWTTRPLKFARKGDVLICVVGATVGKLNLAIDSAIGRSVAAIRPSEHLDTRFLYYSLMPFTLRLRRASRGSGQGVIGREELRGINISFPPIAEQRQIVAKVEELLAFCEELEARQTTAREHRTRLVRSAIDHLTTAQTEREFRQHAAFVLQHSDLLLDSVATLRQAINSLAVEGRLLPQSAKDEPAETLLTRIRSTKRRLAETAGAKPPKEWPAIEVDELAFPLPRSWVATRLGDLASEIEAGFSPQCEGLPKAKDEWSVLKISAVSWDEFDPDENKALPANVEPRPELEVRDGDFIMSRANTAELVAKSVVTSKPPPRLLLNDKTLRVHFTEHTDKRFLNMVNNSSVSRTYYAKAASGTSSSMKNITREGISMLPIALPPLAEQQRIVAKVDELLRWCDALEARLTAAQTTATLLLDATFHQILTAKN